MATLYELITNTVNDPHSKVDGVLRARWHKGRKLTHIELLSILEKTLEADEAHMHSDYHRLFNRCAVSMLVLKTNIAMPVNLITGGSSNVCDLVDEILWETAEAESIQPGFAKAECALSIVAKYIDDCFCATAAESDLSTKNRALLHPQHGKRQTKLEDEVRPDSDSARQTLIKALHLTPAEGTSQEAFISVAGSQVDLTSATLTGRDREYRDATLKAFRGCSDKLKAGTLTKEDLDEAFL